MPLKHFQRTAQITDSTCGPAVLQMLLDFNEIKVQQENIIQAAEIQSTIEKDGISLDQLSNALRRLAPDYVLLYKEDARIEDIDLLVNTYQIPVAIDWQGFFYDSLEEESYSGYLAHGHYSLVTEIDIKRDSLTIVDPYREYVLKDRIFPIGWFKSRWWDFSEKTDPDTRKEITYYTSRLLFVVLPLTTELPESLDLHKVPEDYLSQKFETAKLSFIHHPAFDKKNKFKDFLTNLLNKHKKTT